MSIEAVASCALGSSSAFDNYDQTANGATRHNIRVPYFVLFRISRLLIFLVVLVTFATFFSNITIASPTINSYKITAVRPLEVISMPIDNKTVILVLGKRITKGNAVNCPKIRSDDGTETSVSHLPTDVAIGTRVEVSGYMAVTTKCSGKVLYVLNVRKLED